MKYFYHLISQILLFISNLISQHYTKILVFVVVILGEELAIGIFRKSIDLVKKRISYKYRFYKNFKKDALIFLPGATSPIGIMEASTAFHAPLYSIGIGDAFSLAYILTVFKFLKVNPKVCISPKTVDKQDCLLYTSPSPRD